MRLSCKVLIVSVLDEIEERVQFLEHMKQLGKGAQYESLIRSQIAEVSTVHCVF